MLILACFIREQYTVDTTFTPLENKCWFENSANAWGNIGFFIIKQIRKPRLCSVLLQSTQEAVEHSRSRENTLSGVKRTNHEATAPPQRLLFGELREILRQRLVGQGVTCYLRSFLFLFLFNQARFFFSSLSLHVRVDRVRTVEPANQFMRQTALRAVVGKDTLERIVKKARFLYFSLYNISLLML